MSFFILKKEYNIDIDQTKHRQKERKTKMKNNYRVFIHRLNGTDIAVTIDAKESKKLYDGLTGGESPNCKLESKEINFMTTTYNYILNKD